MQNEFDFTVIDALYASGYHGPRALDQPEFYWRSMLGALVAYRDDFFRPLGEEIAPAESREGVEIEAMRCEYEGSRFHHELPMNISSLRQFGKHWHLVLPTIATLREEYCRRRGQSGAARAVSMTDLWIISKLCQLLPAYLIRRREKRIDPDEIPVVPSIIYRISLGMHRIVHISLIKCMAAGSDPDAPCLPAEAYYKIAEGAGLLVGRNSVCAGPEIMVGQAYRAMIEPQPTAGADANAAESGFYGYAAVFLKLEVEKYLFAVQAACQLRNLIAALSGRTDPAARALHEALARFENWSNEHTSPLAHEIAREDLPMLLQGDQDEIERARQLPGGTVLARMQRGLDALVRAVDALCRSSLGQSSEGLLARIDALRGADDGEPAPSADEFIDQGIDAETAAVVAAALGDYLRGERAATQIFTLLQREIDRTLGLDEASPGFSEQDIAAVFGPRLRHALADHFATAKPSAASMQ
ncbi:hypothetical protein [Burkholderia glumae]|uniref:Uncharacterized protein n=1 Tax=Burkholderia glumae TaxID=337 RepID=A0AAP9XXN5_BURGL|nr:hypothetical protein [Burkholderia glumae]ACR31397.2 Hypothetical protein bglu_2g09930 [Burkholderia glumae BGR1]AJY64740.1 hypothetical protein KS03_4925 [Burkholderia glumae LMG 2196 = ATCC 33617]KHJ62946.1 hypothetical protein NCPPB3923_10810 [Burkholderia glumae]MCM2485444.1 hypothetical protein [Burkholderia glumae]MCM2511138.1 hypothetical protein [Burkholderia glumae]